MPTSNVTARTSPTGLRMRLDAAAERHVPFESDDEESRPRTLFAVDVFDPTVVSTATYGPTEPDPGYIWEVHPGSSGQVRTTGTYRGGTSNLTERSRVRLATGSHMYLFSGAQSFVQKPRGIWFIDLPFVNFRRAPRESNESDLSVLSDSDFLDRTLINVGRRSQSRDPSQASVRLAQVDLKLAEELTDLATLEPGWDGYGADPPTPQAVEATAALLLTIHGLTDAQLENLFVSPLPDGGLEIDWELRTGSELMLVAPPEGTDVRYLLDKRVDAGDVIEAEGVVPGDATLSELVDRLTAE